MNPKLLRSQQVWVSSSCCTWCLLWWEEFTLREQRETKATEVKVRVGSSLRSLLGSLMIHFLSLKVIYSGLAKDLSSLLKSHLPGLIRRLIFPLLIRHPENLCASPTVPPHSCPVSSGSAARSVWLLPFPEVTAKVVCHRWILFLCESFSFQVEV